MHKRPGAPHALAQLRWVPANMQAAGAACCPASPSDQQACTKPSCPPCPHAAAPVPARMRRSLRGGHQEA
eukprot:225876-Pelagomonas_calceolata.AAC.9